MLIIIEGTRAASERENGPELSPQPDPLTQAAQHKCCNPLLSTSNKAFTRKPCCSRPSLYLVLQHNTYATSFPCSHTILRLSDLHNPPMPRDQASVCFCSTFTPDRIISCLGLARVLRFWFLLVSVPTRVFY